MPASIDPPPHIIVVGAGVIGLTTAVLLQRRHSGNGSPNVTIIASEFPSPGPLSTESTSVAKPASADYASMWAGAHYRPITYLDKDHPSFSDLSDEQQCFHLQLANEKSLAVRTAVIMKILAREDPKSGIEIVPAAEHLERPPPENLALKTGNVYASPDDGFRVFDKTGLDEMNSNAASDGRGHVQWACEYESYVVNVHVYCAWLLQQFRNNGGRTVRQKLDSLTDGLRVSNTQSTPILVNCSGINMGRDPETKIIRGQTVLVKQQYDKTVTRQCVDGTWSFLIPRPLGGGTIVGGTKQIGDTDTSARAEERARLLRRAAQYFPEFVSNANQFEVVADNVGKRPWRKGGMRIESDRLESAQGRVPVIHGYGAGGRGYELSWGAAEEICRVVDKVMGPAARL